MIIPFKVEAIGDGGPEDAAATASAVLIPEVILADLGIGANIGRFRADLTVNNLLDRRYFTSTGNANAVFPGDPRTVSFRLGANF